MSLVITRRLNERVMIGPDIIVTVIGIKSGQIRLAIDAPKEIAVHREEVYERIKAEGLRGYNPETGVGAPYES